ncbi:MAG: TolC family protein [Ignavibacteria bacterium]
MRRVATVLLFIILPFAVNAQVETLEQYINEGLRNNLALKQKTFSFERSIFALDQARGMFFPSVEINARYTRAGGGRTIDIPIGDIVNPIYSGLNQIIGSDIYPTNIQNEQVMFLREKEHETKVSLIQPIFQPKIIYNYNIKENLKDIQKAERDIYARELIAEIKTAYFNYLKTLKVVELFNKTEELLKENLRVSESLYKNHKSTVDVVYRAKAELSDIKQQLADAENNEKLAKAYFNFLLNKDLETEIEIDKEVASIQLGNFDFDESIHSAVNKREELKQLESAIEASSNNISLSRSSYLPGVSLAVDYGFQGEEYNFTSDDDFWMASVVFNWNIFNGFQDKAKVEQAEWSKKENEAKLNEVLKQIKLQVRTAYYNLDAAKKSITTANDRLTTSQKSFEIVAKKYKEGMAPQIEYLDSRTSLTQAEVNKIVTKYDYLIRCAEFEKVTAAYPVNEKLKKIN